MERNKYLVEIVKEMCKRVGADPEIVGWKDDPNHDHWYWRYTWTKAEEDRFIFWLADYFKTNRDARADLSISGGRISTKKYCQKMAEEFVWNWGWKVEKK